MSNFNLNAGDSKSGVSRKDKRELLPFSRFKCKERTVEAFSGHDNPKQGFRGERSLKEQPISERPQRNRSVRHRFWV